MRLRLWPVAVLLAFAGAACDEVTDSNGAPEASAGEDVSVFVGESVTLNGSGSVDPDGDVMTFAWALTAQPDTSNATLAVTDTEDVTFGPDVPGTYTFTLTVSDGDDSATDEVVVTAAWDLRLTGSFSADTTLADRGAPYTVAANFYVSAGTLTIAPGVRIEFAQDARLVVSTGAALVAAGTETDSIHFVGAEEAAGHWEGIEIASASPLNELSYVEIAHGGANGYSNLYVQSGGAVAVSNSLIRDSETVGVDSDGSLAGWSANTLQDNVIAGVQVGADAVRYLDAASVYAGGTTPYALKVTGGGIETAGTWPKTDKPYLMSGAPYAYADVVLQAGVEMAFEQDDRFVVAEGGSLSAVGTAEDTIRFYGTQATAGFWEGIEVQSASTSNELTYVEIAHGGGNGYADLYVHPGAVIKVTNSLLRDSETVGIENDGALTGWATNTLRDNVVAGIELAPETIRYLDAASTYAGGTTPHALLVTAGTAATAGTWPKTDKPYRMSGTMYLEAAVTVEPGATLLFEQDDQLIVTAGGSLTAEGTANDTITFSAIDPVAGVWDGIDVQSLSGSNSLDYVNIGFGGRNSYANIYIRNGAGITVSNSLIHDSAACGVEVFGTGSYTESGNTYSNNTGGNVCF